MLEVFIKDCWNCLEKDKEFNPTNYIPKNQEKNGRPCRECLYFRRIEKLYGVDKEWYLEKSKNGCQICNKNPDNLGQKRGLSIDHDHKTGITRGVLCSTCNQRIGMYFDNEDTFKKIMEYLNA